ncbi:site-2 protease family protein [Candidatus Electronema sp. JM]|uniref:site-2 protease family protein n=1 Tax=Candidatus Electronema sp. JM TaxID=3401571 RepID=UPI003AA93372
MDIRQAVIQFLILAPPFLFALTLHELAHGWTAWRLGDPTAKNDGRLTLNPIKHLDLFGALLFIFAHIGWAKPVPVNPSYFKNPRKGMLLVALAGPGANLLLAVGSALLFRLLLELRMPSPFLLSLLEPLAQMLLASVWINIMLAVFNCLPIPPLDGSKVLAGLLPPDAARSYARMEPYGIFLLFILFYSDIISKVITPLIQTVSGLLLG